MGLISPKELYEKPSLWLSVPHELHSGGLFKLMCQIYPDFIEKLHGIHCYRCEGKEPFEVYTIADRQRGLAVGHVDYPEKAFWVKQVETATA